jgi:hypothetical protein
MSVSTKGNQISQSDIDSNAPDTEVMGSLFERQKDQSPSAGEASPAAVVDQSTYNGPKINAESSTTNDSASCADVNSLSHPSDNYIGQECTGRHGLQDVVTHLRGPLQRISIPTADQIPASEFEFYIPKEKYVMVKDAMDKSKTAIFVKCDDSKKFVRAVPDVDVTS